MKKRIIFTLLRKEVKMGYWMEKLDLEITGGGGVLALPPVET
jgi:hypothetical protein